MKTAPIIVGIILLLSMYGCFEKQDYMLDETGQKQERVKDRTGIANPATLHCMNTTGAVWSVKEGDGGQYGVCTFSDGSWCEEWAYYNGHCNQGDWMTLCGDQYKTKTVCPPDYAPVCGYLNSTDEWEDFSNACKACLDSEGGAMGYVLGKCS